MKRYRICEKSLSQIMRMHLLSTTTKNIYIYIYNLTDLYFNPNLAISKVRLDITNNLNEIWFHKLFVAAVALSYLFKASERLHLKPDIQDLNISLFHPASRQTKQRVQTKSQVSPALPSGCIWKVACLLFCIHCSSMGLSWHTLQRQWYALVNGLLIV